jgi:uncharacterized protein (DUF305 family)
VRSRVAVIGLVLAVCVAVAGIALAVWAGAERVARPDPATTADPVSATDFCYVEAMIYYRVEATDLSDALLQKDGITPAGRELAEQITTTQADELEQLRPWYVSWREHRPLERPNEGPCAGHADHAQMPGMPTPAQWSALLAAEGADAERTYAQLLIAQHEAMVAFATQILDGDPHPRVGEAAEHVIEQGERDIAALEGLVAALP